MLRAILLSLPLAGCAYSQGVDGNYYRVGVPLSLGSYNLNPNRPTAELAADRRIAEQDCSRPVDFTLGNLRCK